jgi:diguanylate cyclase (GGDEF)-like protein/PAS domain S-box-containing protein
METPIHINELNKKYITASIVNLKDEKERIRFFAEVLKVHGDEVYSFIYGNENGDFYGARRGSGDNLELVYANSATEYNAVVYSIKEDLTKDKMIDVYGIFDTRKVYWYQKAKEVGNAVYSPIYNFPMINDLIITATDPIYNKSGDLEGVLGTHVLLSKINNMLKDAVQDDNGYAYIVEKSTGKLVANSFDYMNYIMLEDGTFQRKGIDEIDNKALIKAYHHYIDTNEGTFTKKIINDELFFECKEYTQNGLDWVVISAVPESLLNADMHHSMVLTGLLIIISVTLLFIIYYAIISKLLKPINNLIIATDKFSKGDLSQRVEVVRCDEIGQLSIVFNKMASTMYWLIHGLEEKVSIRTSELEVMNRALEENKDQLRVILDSTAEGICGIDTKGNCTFCNTSCIEILGYEKEEELLGLNVYEMVQKNRNIINYKPFEECEIIRTIQLGERYKNTMVFNKVDGNTMDLEYYCYPQYNKGEVVGAVFTFIDITERKKDEEQIRYLSSHDSLTGLINRHCFQDAIRKYDKKANLPLSMIFADVNGLKMVNDIFGHSAGDILIKKSAEILTISCRETDIVARLGGDEFVILLPNTKKEEAKKLLERIRHLLENEKVNGVECSMALGLDTKDSTYQDIDRIMENAENDMYKNKSLSRTNFNTNMINTFIETLHEKSPAERIHSEKVSELCEDMGKALKLPTTEIKKLKDAGYYHDIGKIVLDMNIINNKGNLSKAQDYELKQHPIVSYRILNLFDETLDLANGAYSHHEKWNGTGFPKGLKGEEIPLISRIIGIAECYERYISKENKEDINTIKKALEEVRGHAGIEFDPNLTELFVQMIKEKYQIQ